MTVIPHTVQNTTIRTYRPGSLVNLETDIIAKHVAKLLEKSGRLTGLTVEKLRGMGY